MKQNVRAGGHALERGVPSDFRYGTPSADCSAFVGWSRGWVGRPGPALGFAAARRFLGRGVGRMAEPGAAQAAGSANAANMATD